MFPIYAGRRLVVTCFASHIHRVQQVIDAALACNRKVATLGRSMAKNVELARRLNLLHVPDDAFVDVEDIDKLDPGRVCVDLHRLPGRTPVGPVSHGRGGEQMAQLDRVTSSSSAPTPFPVTNGPSAGHRSPHRRGAEVIHTGMEPVHVSGHARQGELQTLLAVARPEWFIPVHGEYRHMVHHARLAVRMGVAEDKALLCEDGDSVVIADDGVWRGDDVPAGFLYVDGTVGDVGHGVLRDRRVLAEEGVVVVVATVDPHQAEVVSAPEIITRGWIHAPEAEELLEEASLVVRVALEKALADGAVDQETLRRHARKALGKLVGERTRRRPMIVPVVVIV